MHALLSSTYPRFFSTNTGAYKAYCALSQYYLSKLSLMFFDLDLH